MERAAEGDREACSRFAVIYLGVVRSYLAKRWRGTPAISHLEDAVQEVFLDLFRPGGALARFDPTRAPNFRPFLFGVAHKVALRQEERQARDRGRGASLSEIAELHSADASASQLFDREWARCLLKRARERQAELAKDEAAVRRLELLRLRFAEDLPIREIAARWQQDAAHLHHEYAKAREEFKQALRAEVGYHHTGTAAEVERECQMLLELLRGSA